LEKSGVSEKHMESRSVQTDLSREVADTWQLRPSVCGEVTGKEIRFSFDPVTSYSCHVKRRVRAVGKQNRYYQNDLLATVYVYKSIVLGPRRARSDGW